VRLLQPSSCHLQSRQFADDCDNKIVANSSDDDHIDVVVNCFWRNNRDDNYSDHDCDDSDHNDADVRNGDNSDHNRAIVFRADDL
jgi:hypothetical protein